MRLTQSFLLSILTVISSWSLVSAASNENSIPVLNDLVPMFKLDGNVVRICQMPHDTPTYSHVEESTIPRNIDEIRRVSFEGLRTIESTESVSGPISQFVNFMGPKDVLEEFAKQVCATQFKNISMPATEIVIVQIDQKAFDLIRQTPIRVLKRLLLNRGRLGIDTAEPTVEDKYLKRFKCVLPPNTAELLPPELLAKIEKRQCDRL